MDRAIFLDFDGVLFDTAKEAYAVCLMTEGKTENVTAINFASRDYKIFKRFRYLIGPAWNYYYLFKTISDVSVKSRASTEIKYLSYINNANVSDYKPFEEKYFTNRELLKKNHESFWFSLNVPYVFTFNLATLINKYRDNFFILTTKDKSTVMRLLESNGGGFNANNIYDRGDFEELKSKGAIIRNIMHCYSIIDAIFVDDSRLHLDNCKDINGLKIIQPKWGYIGPKDSVSQEEAVLAAINNLLRGV